MIRKYTVSILFLMAVLILYSLPAQAAYSTWQYKLKITVNNPGSSVTDYPVRINIPAKTFIDAGRMNSDLRDIRFSDSSGYALPFWISISEGMQRTVNNFPVYVKLKNFNSGDNTIYLHFDITKVKTNGPPTATYTEGTSTDYCGDGGSTNAPYTHNACGDRVFALFSFNYNDTDWARYTTSPIRFIDIKTGGAPFGNSFDLYFRGHYYNPQELYVYFLTQLSTTPATSTTAQNIANYCGYRLFIDHLSTSTASQTYNMGNLNLIIQKKDTSCGTGSSGWTNVATFSWNAYNNSIQDFNVRVTSSNIALYINGNLKGTYTRTDSWPGGHVGFNKNTWTSGAETGSNSTDGISPIWVTKNYAGEPSVTFWGNTDLTIKRLKPTTDASYFGQDIIETTAAQQVKEDYVDGNTLEKYIYSAFPLASLESQVFRYSLKVRNRGTASDTFSINLTTTGDMNNWYIAYDYGSGLAANLPGGGGTPTTGSVTVSGGSEQTIEVFVMPSSNALFEGGQGKLTLDFAVNSQADFSFDNVRFVANVRGKSGCYWKWKMPITISYDDTNSTGDLTDYQVLVNLSGVTEFLDALPNGSDIIFTDSQGTMLPFYKKVFNQGSGDGSFWIKIPKVFAGSPGQTNIYMWWGNDNYTTSRSSQKDTFALDGTTDCNGYSNDPYDLNKWKNIPDSVDNYNWWRIRSRLDGQAVMADRGSSNVSDDIGPMLTGGDIRWKSYEVSYSFYDEYENYNPGYGNPQYNPVYYQDPGNGWGMEYFKTGPGGLFIFRPFGYGTDWTWTYQANAYSLLGNQAFPTKNKRYWAKVKLFQNPADNNRTHLKLHIAPSTPSDTDSDSSPFVEITPSGGFISDPAFNIDGGMIGLGGWNGGFSFDNIRVRKYTEPEPACAGGGAQLTNFDDIESLSTPYLTPPLMNGRPVLLTATILPWAWTGNLTAVFADCFISGDCQSGEVQSQLGTISLWGSIDADTPKGFGDQLMEAVAGDNNRASIDDSNWKSSGRYIYTAYDSDSDGDINCTNTTTGDCLAFGLTNCPTGGCSTFINLLGVSTDTDAQNLIKFSRGQYVAGYSRSDDINRNRCTSGTADTCQWKLGDVIHSNPLIVGIPNMIYADPDYAAFMSNNNSRDMIGYFSSNEGILHAVRMAVYDTTNKKYTKDATATELWTFIPNAVLPMLKKTTDLYHEYTTDGLFRAIDIKTGGAYKTVLVGGLRSGGQSLFALDITNPRSPNLMWEINASINPTQFSNIGESWSAPAIGRLCETSPCDPNNTSNRWVAIIGSGFDPNDINNLSKNAYLSVINLETGAVIKQVRVSTKPGNITTNLTVLRDAKYGYIQKVFFGDYYGALWRIDLSTTASIAAFLGKTALDSSDMLFQPIDYATSNINTTGASPQRAITSQPRIAHAGNNQFLVYFGTGVYNEYDSNYPYQRFYGLIDRTSASPYTDADLIDMTASTATNPNFLSWFIELGHSDSKDVGFSTTVNASCVSTCTSQGYGSDYCNSICKEVQSSTKDRNERVLTPPEVYGGYVFFSTYTPQNNPCGGGTSRFYGVSYKTGAYAQSLMLASDASGNVPATRSIEIAAGQGVPSSPMIFVGKSGEGQIVAAGLVNVSTGSLIKIMLNPAMFTDAMSILLWREIR
ncbi:MAG: DUF2341 domain-containing protein [Nitrospirae bacterium]|nr:DUF2341 domain-containing protein [Nitrospirota bacterium]